MLDCAPDQLEAVQKMTKDIKRASLVLSETEARYLVDAYYQMQDNRIAAAHQARTLKESGEPNLVISWLMNQNEALENEVKKALDAYSNSSPLGRWARSQYGIGPVIAAGLLAHISFDKAQTAGDIWNFAGLNPGVEWNKGEKRPWNADLKRLAWLIGESFVKVSGNENAFYGKCYAKRKEEEVARNDRGEFADQARLKLEKFKIGKDTDAYKAYVTGKLPPAHVHARAKRWAVKMFLAHYFEVGYQIKHGKEGPKPYAIVHLGHAHYIAPPNWPMEEWPIPQNIRYSGASHSQ